MDEPFGALDAQMRLILQDKLLEIWKETQKTVISVTHDHDEAVTLGDRVGVFSKLPGTIKFMENINISRPRDVMNTRFLDEFTKAYSKLWNALKDEFEMEVRR
ncbi:hypothetical protein [Paenibacillus sp. Soil787]|uniref:hypothetical protein n=1 Tax=Paenibacillus sp. Soil787 TaxID=1736411 RepID=UPI0006FD144D|nr:hypothetical protein [Paenibacillus sp. Soil787]KRF43535.1 hypothetical protein ASG93_00995 [Paenibacillus sp. Soil787]